MIDKKFRKTSKEILVETFNFLHSRVWVGDDEVRERVSLDFLLYVCIAEN